MEDIKERLRKLLAQKMRPVLLLGGLGGAGKTSLADEIAKKSDADSIVLHCDWWLRYPTEERKKRIRHALASNNPKEIEAEENPKNWYDWEQMKTDLLRLQETGRIVLEAAWDQQTGLKNLKVPLELPEHGMIICEGIYMLHPEITEVADCLVFLDVPKDVCRKRAEARDGHRSSPEYLAYKAALVDKYAVPYFRQYNKNADMVIKRN